MKRSTIRRTVRHLNTDESPDSAFNIMQPVPPIQSLLDVLCRIRSIHLHVFYSEPMNEPMLPSIRHLEKQTVWKKSAQGGTHGVEFQVSWYRKRLGFLCLDSEERTKAWMDVFCTQEL